MTSQVTMSLIIPLHLVYIFIYHILQFTQDFPGGSEVKVSACSVGYLGSIPGSGRSPGEGNGNPLQYSCLENPMDGGAWWATVHGVAKSRTRLSDLTFTFTFQFTYYILIIKMATSLNIEGVEHFFSAFTAFATSNVLDY